MSQTVLVADDSRTIRQVVEMALKAAPFDVIGVGSAREAMEAAQQRPAVILLDYYMPDGSGYDICRALKGNAATSGIPVIMLGGTYKSFDADLAHSCGADKVVMKPFKTDDLLDAIESVVGTAPSTPFASPAPPALEQQPANNWGTPEQALELDETPPPMPASPSAFQSTPPAAPKPIAEPANNWGATPPTFGGPPSPESQPRIATSTATPPRIGTGSYPRSAAPDVNASFRQPMQTPAPVPDPPPSLAPPTGESNSGLAPTGGHSGGMSRSQMENFIREQVRNMVRDELPGLLRNVIGEVVQQKVLPKLVKHVDDKVQETLRRELDTRIIHQVRDELERLLSEE